MPPRFVYWTILIDGKPTAFRARDQEELLPTVSQLKRTNQDVVMKWFARGKLWDSPEAERAAERPAFTGEKRGADWRPGGTHKDPRDRFKKKNRPERAWSDKDSPTRSDREKLGPPAQGERRPFASRPAGGDRKPWSGKPQGPRKPWTPKPEGQRKPWSAKPEGARKPWTPRPDGPRKPWSPTPDGPRKPWSPKPDGPRKPWSAKPAGARKPWAPRPDGPRKPWTPKPDGPRKPWSPKPDSARKPWGAKPDAPRKPWQGKPREGGWQRNRPPDRKRRDDDPHKK